MKAELLRHRGRNITLEQLEKLYFTEQHKEYVDFAESVLQLERDGIIEMVKAQGRNGKEPSLAYKYRINRHLLNEAFHSELLRYRMELDEEINLDAYFSMDYATWQADLPYLLKVNEYLKVKGFPHAPVSASQRSFELVGNEKWIEKLKGKDVLQRIGLWDRLLIHPASDPLMLAINPNRIQEKRQLHLIVENKATYQGLLPVLAHTDFSTLVFGYGNKVSGNFENFPVQYPVEADHVFYYFGDLDRSGITIWDRLQKHAHVRPAVPFYEAYFDKIPVAGKTNQIVSQEALRDFLAYFSDGNRMMITRWFDEGKYLPQEVLDASELQMIWRNAIWKN